VSGQLAIDRHLMNPDRDAYEVLEVHPKAHQQVIQAAYRVLAALYHPDRDPSASATRRMTDLNAAYDKVRTRERRELYDRGQQLGAATTEPIVPAWRAEQPASPPGNIRDTAGRPLDFGRYAGWTIKQIAPRDPDYLRWLSRHSSGIRFRAEIEAALRKQADVEADRQRARAADQ
jgi:curved DNA-binding protein CbpA